MREPEVDEPVKIALTEEQNTELVKIVDKLINIDMAGETLVFSQMTNEEVLSIGELYYNMKYSGFDGMNWNMYLKMCKKYLNVPDAAQGEAVCWLCGQPVVRYSEADGYAWLVAEHTHDTRDDVSKVYNIYQESWTDGEKYYLTMYKLFPDLMKNSNPAAINFYPTYTDAANMENALFTATTDAEYTENVENLDYGKCKLYTYIFVADENGKNFKLEEYKF